MFHVPILVLAFVVRRVVSALASRGLSPVCVIGSARENPSWTKQFSEFFVVSVTDFFFAEPGC